ncbi:MAG: hypothetical protein HC913_14600, partial [Microscillaceae bacterium]|nr:hypothetical protein [Microscillaceae bacterium]
LWVLPTEPHPAQVLSGSASRDAFRALLYALLQVQAEGQFPLLPPDLPQKPGEGREMIVFISDLYQAQDEMVQCLRRWRGQQHEVICLHLLAQNELTLDYGQDARFEDWETGQRKTVHLASARTQYLEHLQTHLQALRQAVLAQQVEYASFGMHEALEQVFRLFLERRKRLL